MQLQPVLPPVAPVDEGGHQAVERGQGGLALPGGFPVDGRAPQDPVQDGALVRLQRPHGRRQRLPLGAVSDAAHVRRDPVDDGHGRHEPLQHGVGLPQRLGVFRPALRLGEVQEGPGGGQASPGLVGVLAELRRGVVLRVAEAEKQPVDAGVQLPVALRQLGAGPPQGVGRMDQPVDQEADRHPDDDGRPCAQGCTEGSRAGDGP